MLHGVDGTCTWVLCHVPSSAPFPLHPVSCVDTEDVQYTNRMAWCEKQEDEANWTSVREGCRIRACSLWLKSQYQLPHHTANDGPLRMVWRPLLIAFERKQRIKVALWVGTVEWAERVLKILDTARKVHSQFASLAPHRALVKGQALLGGQRKGRVKRWRCFPSVSQ